MLTRSLCFRLVGVSCAVLILTYAVYSSTRRRPSYPLLPLADPSPSSAPRLDEDTLLDLTGFRYLIYNDPCGGRAGLRAVQVVTSFAGDVEARSALRKAYPPDVLDRLGVARVFLLARLKPGQGGVTQNALLHENKRYRDLLQGDFYESYRNLTYKHAMGLKWASLHCGQAPFIIKMDDDIAFDLYSLLSIIQSVPPDALSGYVLENMKPIRITANKWYVTYEEFPGTVYPKFLSGWLYVISSRTASLLVHTAQSMPYFWIDDLFLTGIAAEKLPVEFNDLKGLFTLHPEVIECCIRFGTECGFAVGPTGGDYSLHYKFARHAEKCREGKCRRMGKGRTVESACVADRKLPRLGKGMAELRPIKL